MAASIDRVASAVCACRRRRRRRRRMGRRGATRRWWWPCQPRRGRRLSCDLMESVPNLALESSVKTKKGSCGKMIPSACGQRGGRACAWMQGHTPGSRWHPPARPSAERALAQFDGDPHRIRRPLRFCVPLALIQSPCVPTTTHIDPIRSRTGPRQASAAAGALQKVRVSNGPGGQAKAMRSRPSCIMHHDWMDGCVRWDRAIPSTEILSIHRPITQSNRRVAP